MFTWDVGIDIIWPPPSLLLGTFLSISSPSHSYRLSRHVPGWSCPFGNSWGSKLSLFSRAGQSEVLPELFQTRNWRVLSQLLLGDGNCTHNKGFRAGHFKQEEVAYRYLQNQWKIREQGHAGPPVALRTIQRWPTRGVTPPRPVLELGGKTHQITMPSMSRPPFPLTLVISPYPEPSCSKFWRPRPNTVAAQSWTCPHLTLHLPYLKHLGNSTSHCTALFLCLI